MISLVPRINFCVITLLDDIFGACFTSKLDLDEGHRAIQHLQEMLLPDGDLTADGKGRERKFRWKNIGMHPFLSGLYVEKKVYLFTV